MEKEQDKENWKKKVREEELRQKEKIEQCPYRMQYHIMPPIGWLNDPNGLCQFQGTYQAYFQYSPFSVNGGGGFWGHCTSKDLLHWQYEDPVLTTDQKEDQSGVYSGSALIEDGRMYLFYTGNVKLPGEYDYIDAGRISSQMMVVSQDGREMSKKRKVLGMEDYPEEITAHVRDPKVWKKDGQYAMILGARKRAWESGERKDTGGALIYISKDKINWKLEQEIFPKQNFGYMWECPDLFDLEGETILSYCPQGLAAEAERFQNLYQSGYSILSPGVSPEENFVEWDMGFDFYAPQTFQTDDGRRILIGWAGVPDTVKTHRNLSVEHGWQHCLTLPRELMLENGKVYQRPVREIGTLCWEALTPESDGFCFGKHMVKIDAVVQEETPLEIRIGTKENHLLIRGEENQITLSFQDGTEEAARCGGGRQRRIGRTAAPLHNLLILIDNSIVELFANDGELVMTTRIYLEMDERRIEASGCQTCNIRETKE